MKVKALTGFAGAVCMAAGESRDIPDESLARELANAGYVEIFEGEHQAETPPEQRQGIGKAPKRGVNKDEDKPNHT